ncbi:MAG: choice-of-anchor J domain-containing protein [Bacteroidetes bacterium]|nr:choice-of-anchor J domain-containing protein [Bacteroidota bacterium]
MKNLLLYTLVVLTLVFSCKKPDTTPTRNLGAGVTYRATDLKSIATSTTGNNTTPFPDNTYYVGTVIADESSGNFYKELYLRDGTGALHVTFKASKNGYFIGDSVRLNLGGYFAILNASNGLLEVDSVDFDKSMIRLGKGVIAQPITLTNDSFNFKTYASHYYGQLVKLNNVYFSAGDAGQLWSDAIGGNSVNRNLQDCWSISMPVRTSSYAKFATQTTPVGQGSIIGILASYNGTTQLTIRNTGEVNMNNPITCSNILFKNFSDLSLASGGWSQMNVLGASSWAASNQYPGPGIPAYAKISGYISGNTNCENWLLSPQLNLTSTNNPILSFQTAAKYVGDTMAVFASTNYTPSTNPNSATWTQLNAIISPNGSSFVWTYSGLLSLAPFKQPSVTIGFRYKSSTTKGATTYEVSNILIKEL